AMTMTTPPTLAADVLRRLSTGRDAQLEELCQWLRIGSVSSDPAAGEAMQQAARWVEAKLRSAGLATERIATTGFDLVYAETAPVPGAPVVLVYGHYGVQP